jgi:hypothetical protein
MLPRVNFSLELLINQDDILNISKILFEILEKDISTIIIISSEDQVKPLRVYNFINRLIDCGAKVFWNTDDKIYSYQSHFLIFDKTNVINKIFFQTEDDFEKQVFYFNNIFEKILKDSEEIFFNDDKIKIDFNADKTIINKNQIVKLNWKVENADYFNISPSIKNPMESNSIKLQLQIDTLFKLEASNLSENVSKYLYIKVVNHSELNIDIKVFDPMVKDFIFLRPYFNSKIEKYVCYLGQKVVIQCRFNPLMKVKEKKIGSLLPNEEFSFIIKENKNFSFSYSYDGVDKFKDVIINAHRDKKILDLINKNS